MLTTDFVPGAPAWIELSSPDVVAATGFYSRVLGWEYDDGLFRHDGRTVAGHVPSDVGTWTVCFAGDPARRHSR